MECDKVKNIIIEKNLLDISSQEYMDFNNHIQLCEKCANLFKEFMQTREILRTYYKDIPINWQAKEKALKLIDKYGQKVSAFSLAKSFAFAIIMILVILGTYKYVWYSDNQKKQTEILTNLVYIHSDKSANWVTTNFRNPVFSKMKLKKCEHCKQSESMKVFRFKVKNSYVSFFMLNRKKYRTFSDISKYFELNNKFVYVCNMSDKAIHIWVSDIPLEEIVQRLLSSCLNSVKDRIRVKTKKLYCPCCLYHIIRTLKKYRGCILGIDYKSSEVILKVQGKENIEDIKSFF